MAVVDRDLSQHSAELAERVEVLPGLDVRLVRIDGETEVDEYHVMQGLRDAAADASDPKCCYAYQRWGSTGSRGVIKLDGPWEQSKVEGFLAKAFRELTGGAELGSLAVGTRTPTGFRLQHASQPDLQARWKYYVADGVDGKCDGWYPYTPAASEEVEEVYAQHVANAGIDGSHVRWVSSGYFTYKVDLSKMTQENTRTKKRRTIRRSFSEVLDVASGTAKPRAKKAARKKAAAPRRAVVEKAGRGRKLLARPAASASGSGARRAVLKGVLKRKAKEPKAKKALKAKKARKPRAWGSKAEVYKGLKERTRGGLRKADLVLDRRGKAVSKRYSEAGRSFGLKNIAKWTTAFVAAREELGLRGFVPCKKGTQLYTKTHELWSATP